MKICMFSPFSFSMESSTHRLVSFAEELVKRGNTVSIVLPSFDRHTNFKKQKFDSFNGINFIQPYQPKIHSIELSTAPYVLSSFLKQLSLHFDVFHVLKPLPITSAPYFLKPLKGTPILQDMDDLDHNVILVEQNSVLKANLVELCEKIFPTFSNHITTCSSSLREIYIHMGFNGKKITWLPNGVKTSDFNINPAYFLKEDIGLRDKVVVFLGSLNNRVQVYPLIKAIKLIINKRNDTSCMIIGDGIEKPFFVKLVKDLHLTDYVRFTGKIPYHLVAKYLSICDIGFACFTPPLLNTGGALKVFMYMAAGLPVVVNPVGDLPFYIDYGNAGSLSQLDSISLANAFLDLLDKDNIRKQKGNHAKEYVRKNFDWAVLSSRLIQIYKGLL